MIPAPRTATFVAPGSVATSHVSGRSSESLRPRFGNFAEAGLARSTAPSFDQNFTCTVCPPSKKPGCPPPMKSV